MSQPAKPNYEELNKKFIQLANSILSIKDCQGISALDDGKKIKLLDEIVRNTQALHDVAFKISLVIKEQIYRAGGFAPMQSMEEKVTSQSSSSQSSSSSGSSDSEQEPGAPKNE